MAFNKEPDLDPIELEYLRMQQMQTGQMPPPADYVLDKDYAEKCVENARRIPTTRLPTTRPLPTNEQLAAKLKELAAAKEAKVAHGSGATSSHFSPFSFYCTFEGTKLTCMRFVEGNRKHEKSDPVYQNANWMKAFKARDVAFFRDRAGHALEHLMAEMRGEDDLDPGGNLGAVGWWQDVMAFVKKNDPFLYGAIQGKWDIRDTGAGMISCGQGQLPNAK